MADTNMTVVEGQAWQLSVDRAGKATIKTANKYVDRNIEVNVPQAALTLSATSVQKSTSAPEVTASIDTAATNSISKAATISTTAPAEGDYFIIKPAQETTVAGSTVASVSGAINVTTNGFLAADDAVAKTVNGADLTISGIEATKAYGDTYYLPIKKLTEGMVTASSNLVEDESGTKKDSLKVTVSVPAGYYDGTPIEKSFDDLLPALDADATAEFILIGQKAYDEDGKVIVGTMSDNSESVPTLTNVAGETTITSASAVTLSDNDASGLAISATGKTTASAKIPATGYYVANSAAEPITTSSTEATKYISKIAIATGKTLEEFSNSGTVTKVVNQGSIKALEGVGTIESVEGSQTIDSLTGTLTIKAVSDIDADNQNGSAGKVVLGDGDAAKTLIVDGKLVASTATAVPQEDGTVKIIASEGWTEGGDVANVAAGSYDVSCTKVNPSIELKKDEQTTVATTDTNTGYTIVVGVEATKGSHTATAEIKSAGYLATGSKSTTAEEIGVTGADQTISINLVAADFASGLSTEKQANTIVPAKYNTAVSVQGYTAAANTVVDSIDVFDGAFSWA